MLLLIGLLLMLVVQPISPPSISEPTPTPVLTPARDRDLLPLFESLMLSNQGCELPCWWGFVAGETSLSDVSSFLQNMGFDRAWRESGLPFSLETYLQYGEPITFDFADNWEGDGSTDVTMRFTFFEEDKKLRAFAISFARPETFQPEVQDKILLPGFLHQLPGVPEVYIDPTYVLSEDLLILYREQGIYTNYKFNLDYTDDFLSATLCAKIEGTRYMTFTLNAIAPDFPHPRAFVPIDELYDVDATTLVEFFREHSQGCLEMNYQPSDASSENS